MRCFSHLYQGLILLTKIKISTENSMSIYTSQIKRFDLWRTCRCWCWIHFTKNEEKPCPTHTWIFLLLCCCLHSRSAVVEAVKAVKVIQKTIWLKKRKSGVSWNQSWDIFHIEKKAKNLRECVQGSLLLIWWIPHKSSQFSSR